MKFIAITAIGERYSDRRLIIHFYDDKETLLKEMPWVKNWEWDVNTWSKEGEVRIFSRAAKRYYSLRKFKDKIIATSFYHTKDGLKYLYDE